MRIIKLKICLSESSLGGVVEHDLFKYFAHAIEYQGRYYYQVGSEIVEMTRLEYLKVINNPYLYYFSTALKLHYLIQKRKKL